MIAAIDAVRVKGDSVGGVVTCIVRNAPRVSTDSLSPCAMFITSYIDLCVVVFRRKVVRIAFLHYMEM